MKDRTDLRIARAIALGGWCLFLLAAVSLMGGCETARGIGVLIQGVGKDWQSGVDGVAAVAAKDHAENGGGE